VFASIASQLGVEIEDMLHVGDREHNDVKGPHALGMKAVLFTATRDRDKDKSKADAICASAADLTGTIHQLVGNG
jgi:putative hydrolase of the HAD superfamily